MIEGIELKTLEWKSITQPLRYGLLKRCKNGQRHWKEHPNNHYAEVLAVSKVSIPFQIFDEFIMLYSVCVKMNNQIGFKPYHYQFNC